MDIETEDFLPIELEDGTWQTGKEREKFADIATKTEIELPGSGILISKFTKVLVDKFAPEERVFYRQSTDEVVGVRLIETVDKDGKKVNYSGFFKLRPEKLVTLIEEYFTPHGINKDIRGVDHKVERSLTKAGAEIVLACDIMHGLPNINRIFTVPLPITHGKILSFPKSGYDERFQSWLSPNAPTINENMDMKSAKEVVEIILKEFPFEKPQDKINAISGMMTPFIKGLLKGGFNTRCPNFGYMANMQRVGKDYLAGMTGIIYEGFAVSHPAISSGDNQRGASDELRKKIMATLISGRKRLHFANCKGHIQNTSLEEGITNTRFGDRILGKSENKEFDNEIDFSFSANTGTTLSSDLTKRTIFINQFLDLENPNERIFDNPLLDIWVKDNRDLILSAFYCIINDWVKNGCISGTKQFASFPEWARVMGGILENAGYGNPCLSNEPGGIAVDSEMSEMRELFEVCFKDSPNIDLSKSEIKRIVSKNGIMAYMDWENKRDLMKFGKKIISYRGRILSNIKMIIPNLETSSGKPTKTERYVYRFGKM